MTLLEIEAGVSTTRLRRPQTTFKNIGGDVLRGTQVQVPEVWNRTIL